ncbi:SPOSA6832_02915 [Sporobolomyces salmonicolor]|uniref:SPOSA6832_02915-mRNA-1:cds n=1 Tax=Sporidiobolus salmonicolor TaxID=5005 RepID=A0A0D6EMP6_SPOSA|nr:SPOSA6832_02915 [Sporobolomyces salmonicolor]
MASPRHRPLLLILSAHASRHGSSIGTGYDLSTSTYSPDGRIFQVRSLFLPPPPSFLSLSRSTSSPLLPTAQGSCAPLAGSEHSLIPHNGPPQVEYAGKAVENSGTVIGLRCKDGVVLAVEKLVLSKLLVPGANRRIASVDLHAGVATAGLLADGRHLAGRARDECESYRENYHTRVPTKVSSPSFARDRALPSTPRTILTPPPSLQILAERLAMYFQAYTLYSSVRPFGLSALVAGWDAPAAVEGSDTLVERRSEGKPALYMVEPSGTFWVRFFPQARQGGRRRPDAAADEGATDEQQGYRGIAIGKGRQLAKTEIEKLPLDTLTAEEALVEAARIATSRPACPLPLRALPQSGLTLSAPPLLVETSIHTVHDDTKDKDFELEMTWISPRSGWKHQPVPQDLADAAEKKAKEIIDAANEMEE